MKAFYILLLACFCSVFFSCKKDGPGCDENPPATETPEEKPGETPDEKPSISEFAHSNLMGIKGNPKGFVEKRIQEEDGEKFEMKYVYSFNEKGNLVKYDPFGDTDLKSRWIPVDARILSYQYDDEDRLVVATFHTMGVDGDDEVYTIEYGNHELYVPVPFAVGTLDLVLQKGIKNVKQNGKKILECDGVSSVTYSNEESMGFSRLTVEGKYSYENSNYPTSLLETKKAEDLLISKRNVVYDFNDKGYLRKQEITVDMSGEYDAPEGSFFENKVIEYKDNASMSPTVVSYQKVSKIEGMEGEERHSLKYMYDDKGLLINIIRISEIPEGENAQESYSYSEFDETGNWVKAEYWLNTDVDETHITGNFIVERNFTYNE